MKEIKALVCPHDAVKNKVKWFDFINYVGRKLGVFISIKECLDFPCFYEELSSAQLIYANPVDAMDLWKRGYLPVAGNDNFDEVVIIANKDAGNSIKDLNGNEVVGVRNQFATLLGVKLLKDMGIACQIKEKASWQEVLTSVYKGKYPYGFLYKDFKDQLTKLSKSLINILYESDEKISSHLLMISSNLEELREPIISILMDMHKSDEGKEILEGINIRKWYPVEDLKHLEEIVNLIKK